MPKTHWIHHPLPSCLFFHLPSKPHSILCFFINVDKNEQRFLNELRMSSEVFKLCDFCCRRQESHQGYREGECSMNTHFSERKLPHHLRTRNNLEKER